MSYGDLNSLSKLRRSEDFQKLVAEVLRLDGNILDKMEQLFPVMLKDYSKVDRLYSNEYISIIVGTLNRFKYKSKCFKLNEYPNRLEFYGVIRTSSNVGTSLFVVSYKEFLEYLIGDSKEELEILAINPNLNRVAKMIYGSSIGNVVDEMNEWFVTHLTDVHTHLYKKNCGIEYKEEMLSDEEKKASENWLDESLQLEMEIAFSLYYESKYVNRDKKISVRNCFDLIKMMELIKVIEDDKSSMIGYGFNSEEDIILNLHYKCPTSYLIEKFTDKDSNSIVDKIKETMGIEYISYSLLEVARNNCYSEIIKDVLSNTLTEVYCYTPELECNMELPKYKLARTLMERNVSSRELSEKYVEVKEKCTPIELDISNLRDYLPHYYKSDSMFMTYKDNLYKTLLLYDNRDKRMTPYAKALCSKYKFNMEKIWSIKSDLSNISCKEELKGEAAVITIAQSEGLKIPNYSKIPNNYLEYFKINPKPIQEVLKNR